MDIGRDTSALSDPAGLLAAATAPVLQMIQYAPSKRLAERIQPRSEARPLVDQHPARPDPQEFSLALDAARLLGLPSHLMQQRAAQLQQSALQANVSMRTCLQVLAASERAQQTPGAMPINKSLEDESYRIGAIACLIGVSQGIDVTTAEAYVRACRPSNLKAQQEVAKMVGQRRSNARLSASFVAIAAYFLYACHLQNRAEAEPSPMRADSAAFLRLTSILGFFYCGSYAMRLALDGLTGTSSINQAKGNLAKAELKTDLKTLTHVVSQNARLKEI